MYLKPFGTLDREILFSKKPLELVNANQTCQVLLLLTLAVKNFKSC